jgi:Tol biopolymer transport system component
VITWKVRQRRIAGRAGLSIALALSGCSGNPSPETLPPLAFVAGGNSVWVLDQAGHSRYVTQGDQPKWTPDHHMLVVSRTGNTPQGSPASNELWLVRADGGDVRQLTSVYPQQARFAAISGGSHPFVLYAADTAIWRMNLDGADTRQVARVVADDLAISKDGTKIAYVPDPGPNPGQALLPALYEINIDGSGRRAIFNGTIHNCAFSSPSWSPDGRWIAFTLCTTKGGGADPQLGGGLIAIWLIHPDGTGLRKLTPGIYPTWSPGGQWIAYEAGSPNGSKIGLFKIRPDGTGRTQLIPYADTGADTGASDPDW